MRRARAPPPLSGSADGVRCTASTRSAPSLYSTAPATFLRPRPPSRAPGIAAPPRSDLRSSCSSMFSARGNAPRPRASADHTPARTTRFTESLQLTGVLETVQYEFSSQSSEKRELEKRISALEVDLARNQDAQKLQTLGSDLGISLTEHRCPTCHQEVTAELLPSTSTVAMAVTE